MKFGAHNRSEQPGETVGRMGQRQKKERELELVMESIDRFEQGDPATADQDEYDRLIDRYHKLRSEGYGPQPYTGRVKRNSFAAP